MPSKQRMGVQISPRMVSYYNSLSGLLLCSVFLVIQISLYSVTSPVLFCFFLITFFSFSITLLSLFGFYIQFYVTFAFIFFQLFFRFLFVFLTSEFVVIPFDEIDILHFGGSSIVKTTKPLSFLDTIAMHNHVGIISNETYFLEKKPEKLPRSLLIPLEKVYLDQKKLTIMEQVRFLKYKGTVPRIITDFDPLTEKLGKTEILEKPYSNDGYRKIMKRIVVNKNLSKEDEMFAVGSLSDAQENIEFMAAQTYAFLTYPGEDIKIERNYSYRHIDFILTRSSGEQILIDVTSPSSKVTDKYGDSYLINKLDKLPKLKNTKLVLYNFAENSASFLEATNKDPRIGIVSNVNFQKLLTAKGIDVDFNQPLPMDKDYFTFDLQPTSFTLPINQAFDQIQFIKTWQ